MRTMLASAGLAAALLGVAGAAHAQVVSFSGTMVALPTTSQVGNVQPPCVYSRPVSMQVDHGTVTVSYADWGQNTIHYRGTIDANGFVQTWHLNGDGSRSILTGQVTGPTFTGFMDRDRQACQYKVVLSAAH